MYARANRALEAMSVVASPRSASRAIVKQENWNSALAQDYFERWQFPERFPASEDENSTRFRAQCLEQVLGLRRIDSKVLNG